MKQFQLENDHQGYSKGTIFEGPKPITDSSFVDAVGQMQIHTNLGEGYFAIGSDQMPFFKEYVESNPNLFQELKTP